jgi:hypothetical protein
MENLEYLDGEDLAVPSDGEVRSTARRQLVGSFVAIVLVAVIASATALRPASHDVADAASHNSGIHQPSFATLPGQRVAAIARHEIELP